MTNPTIFRSEDGAFAWLAEDSDLVQQALAAICESMQGYDDAEIAEACTEYLRDLYNSRTIH
jgi:hypothetical protein